MQLRIVDGPLPERRDLGGYRGESDQHMAGKRRFSLGMSGLWWRGAEDRSILLRG